MIDFSHVYKTYPGPVHALKNINLKVDKGEFIYLTGPSGAGKTTLFRLLSAYDRPSSGSINVLDFRLSDLNRDNVCHYRRKIGVVFQDFRLLDGYTLQENIALPLRILGTPEKEVVAKSEIVMEMVGLLDRKLAYPPQISGGEKQRAAIGRALIHDPQVLIADEPTGNLDPQLTEEITEIFEHINERGTTLLVATHDHELVQKSGRRRLHISGGSLGDIP